MAPPTLSLPSVCETNKNWKNRKRGINKAEELCFSLEILPLFQLEVGDGMP